MNTNDSISALLAINLAIDFVQYLQQVNDWQLEDLILRYLNERDTMSLADLYDDVAKHLAQERGR